VDLRRLTAPIFPSDYDRKHLPIRPLVKRHLGRQATVDKSSNLSYNGLEVAKLMPLTLMPR